MIGGAGQDMFWAERGNGDDVIKNFGFGTDDTSDVINLTTAPVAGVSIDETTGDVTLDLTDGGSLTIEDAAGKTVQLQNQYTNNEPIAITFAEDTATISDEDAGYYWVEGSDATVAISGDYPTEDGVNVNLDHKDFNDQSGIGFNGDIKTVDATGYDGPATLVGSADKDNVLIGGEDESSLWGGKGTSNDTMIGGNGKDMFWAEAGNGEDVIQNFGFGTDDTSDVVNLTTAPVAGVSIDSDTGDVKLDLTDGGSLTIEDAAGKTVQLQNQFTKDEEGNIQPIAITFADGRGEINDSADHYWVEGENAHVALTSNLTVPTVEVDLSKTDFNDTDNITFTGDIKDIDATGYAGDAKLTGNDKNNYIFSGKGDDTLAGDSGADTFVFGNNSGNNVITDYSSDDGDVVHTANTAIDTVAVEGDNVVLTAANSKITVEGAAGNNIKLQNNYTNDTPVDMKVAEGKLEVDDTSKFYWAAGEDATVSLDKYSAESANVNLGNADFNNKDQLSFFGDIQALDATGYAGKATLVGSGDVENIITGGSGESSLWGGNGTGDDTLIGGEGKDMFWYAKNNGNDVIQGATSDDIVKLENMTIDDLQVIGDDLLAGDSNDITFTFKGSDNTLTVKDAKTSGVAIEVNGTKYAVESGNWTTRN